MSRRVAIVLAAGQGKRMRSSTPKVLHRIADQPSLGWVLAACREAGCEEIRVVIGAGADAVRAEFEQNSDLRWVTQQEQRGTGHAVQVALEEDEAGSARDETLVIVYADNPLLRGSTLRRLAEHAESGWAALSVATVEQPGALGRVQRDEKGLLVNLIEARDATPEELEIHQVNAGQYAVRREAFADYLREVGSQNAQGEIYLTDAFVAGASDGRTVHCHDLHDPSEAWGINDRADLAHAHQRLQQRLVEHWLQQGVTFLAPERVSIGPAVRLAADVTVHPDVSLTGKTTVESGCELHQGVWIRDSHLAADVEVHPYSIIDGARIARRCAIGPFARLRPLAELAEDVRIGNFVEVKKSQLASGSKANHLAYIGDATVGRNTNIGAGVVTCNYDGKNKHQTQIGDDAFVGSDTMLVAPVSIGDRALTGAGSVITKDVPADSLALGRARQRNLTGWLKRKVDSEPDPDRE